MDSTHLVGSGDARRARLRHGDIDALITPDPDFGGWILAFDGIEQSHVNLEDPTHVRHEYLRRIANVLDAAFPAGDPLRVLHLGAGALTLPRYLQATRPGSAQTAVDIERELVTFVQAALPLPAGTRLESIVGDARDVLAELSGEGAHDPQRFDAIVLDVFTGEDSPAHLASRAFYDEALAALAADAGVLLVNVGDTAGLRFAAAQILDLDAAAAAIGADGAWVLTSAAMLSGRSAGNLVLAAGPGMSGARATAVAAQARVRGPHPGAVLDPFEAAAFARGLRPAG